MKYPYISTTMNNLLFYAKDTATLIGDESNQFSHGFKLTVDESGCENNTREYLSNTWGVVESKEHAEFIIKLAKSYGFRVFMPINSAGVNHFTITDHLSFHKCGKINSTELKKITIPLPPKAKEWPQVGDEVCWGIASSGVIKSLSDGFAWIKWDNNDYSTVYTSSLKKPKSKQDLLIEELQTKLCNNNAVDNYILACDIINGDIEGLSYDVE